MAQGIQMERSAEDELHASSSCCLVAIGRVQEHTLKAHVSIEKRRQETMFNTTFSELIKYDDKMESALVI